MPPTMPAPHPLLKEEVDAAQLEDGDLELHYVNGEMQILLRGADITDMVTRVSWYWMKGMAPRASLDMGGLSTLDILNKMSTATFRRAEQ